MSLTVKEKLKEEYVNNLDGITWEEAVGRYKRGLVIPVKRPVSIPKEIMESIMDAEEKLICYSCKSEMIKTDENIYCPRCGIMFPIWWLLGLLNILEKGKIK